MPDVGMEGGNNLGAFGHEILYILNLRYEINPLKSELWSG